MSSMECVDVSTFIGREITTVLNVAVDNVILKLNCDYEEAFKNQLNSIATFREESCKLLKVLLSYRSYP